jgi:hypothetical protein
MKKHLRQIATGMCMVRSRARNLVQHRCSRMGIAAQPDCQREQQQRLDVITILGDELPQRCSACS